jgi:hypothetical protein
VSAFARAAILAVLRQHGVSKLRTTTRQIPAADRHLEPDRGGARR